MTAFIRNATLFDGYSYKMESRGSCITFNYKDKIEIIKKYVLGLVSAYFDILSYAIIFLIFIFQV